MTLSGRNDGDDADSGASYLDLAEILIQTGAQTDMDLEQLWRRIVFNVCVSNVDDHLRNHGFLWTSRGWKLSPAYDLNAVSTGSGLKLNISKDDNSQSLELCMSVSHYFRLKKTKARDVINEVTAAVKTWRKKAAESFSRTEISEMQPAFRLAERLPR